ncbi:hypothetical protein E2C01_014849 [Portunus trituberculatus]|uniref:Uncharacterized protein n=1 Tax=Portunus trituberculatus TaxID=210409 RepID=A0A5B7DL65_PORTR|nr:hypothetical protein [Portunus trituberculatus]
MGFTSEDGAHHSRSGRRVRRFRKSRHKSQVVQECRKAAQVPGRLSSKPLTAPVVSCDLFIASRKSHSSLAGYFTAATLISKQ